MSYFVFKIVKFPALVFDIFGVIFVLVEVVPIVDGLFLGVCNISIILNLELPVQLVSLSVQLDSQNIDFFHHFVPSFFPEPFMVCF